MEYRGKILDSIGNGAARKYQLAVMDMQLEHLRTSCGKRMKTPPGAVSGFITIFPRTKWVIHSPCFEKQCDTQLGFTDLSVWHPKIFTKYLYLACSETPKISMVNPVSTVSLFLVVWGGAIHVYNVLERCLQCLWGRSGSGWIKVALSAFAGYPLSDQPNIVQ